MRIAPSGKYGACRVGSEGAPLPSTRNVRSGSPALAHLQWPLHGCERRPLEEVGCSFGMRDVNAYLVVIQDTASVRAGPHDGVALVRGVALGMKGQPVPEKP